jgi:DeoR/GlpR family transcriptional regulator of sugar metabolism
MKDEIINFLKGKDTVSLKDIYSLFPSDSKAKVRSNLNELTNTSRIKRLKRGFYTETKEVVV